jgi:hypothetical protein
MNQRYQLAQLNIALPLAPLDTPQLAEFMAGLAPINALLMPAPASSGVCRAPTATPRRSAHLTTTAC